MKRDLGTDVDIGFKLKMQLTDMGPMLRVRPKFDGVTYLLLQETLWHIGNTRRGLA